MAQTTERPAGAKRLSAAERRAARAAQIKVEQRRRQRRNLRLAALGAVVLAALAFGAIRWQQENQLGVAVPIAGREHVNSGTPITYQHYPPSSGTHYGDNATPPGVYREEQPEGAWVHSLEHGYTVVLVKCADGCPDTYRQLEDLYRTGLRKSAFNNVKFVATPYSKPFSEGEAPIAVLAWGQEMKLQTFDRDKIARFYDTFVDKGPEQTP